MFLKPRQSASSFPLSDRNLSPKPRSASFHCSSSLVADAYPQTTASEAVHSSSQARNANCGFTSVAAQQLVFSPTVLNSPAVVSPPILSARAAMVPTPKRVDAVEVHNASASAVSITITFDDQVKDKTEITETEEIPAGESKLFGEKILDMGSWTAIAPVKHITLCAGNQCQLLEPAVDGIVKVLKVSVTPTFKLEVVAE